MCFAPYISLSSFLIEILLAIYFLSRDPKDKLNQVIGGLSLLLGIYQLNEFLVCITELKIFTILAMSTTAILPAIGVIYALIMWRKELKWYWHALIFSPALFFIICFPFWYDIGGMCYRIFIQYPSLGLLGDFFALYYMLYLAATLMIFYFAVATVKLKFEKRLIYLASLGVVLFNLATFIFIIFLPSMYYVFPSVYCEFGLLLAILFIFVVWYKEKHKIKF